MAESLLLVSVFDVSVLLSDFVSDLVSDFVSDEPDAAGTLEESLARLSLR